MAGKLRLAVFCAAHLPEFHLSTYLHEFVRLVAKESTRFDVGHFMLNLHTLSNCI